MNDSITPAPSPTISAVVPTIAANPQGSVRPAFSRARLVTWGLLLGSLAVPHFALAAVDHAAAEKDKGVTAAAPAAAAAFGAEIDVVPPRVTSFTKAETRMVDNHRVLMIHPPCRVEWTLPKTSRVVKLVYGFDPPAYERGKTNGAELILQLVDKSGTREIFHRLLRPIEVPSDRGAQHSEVALPAFLPGTRLVLQTTGGEYNDTAWDWVYLASLHFQSETEAKKP